MPLFNSAFQQAVAEGISVFVAAGDEGAASCDAGASGATHGIGVSAWASTPYNVAVGGTDFGDTYANTNSTYWASTNSATYGSALSYIPEIPWNDSCASGLLASVLGYQHDLRLERFLRQQRRRSRTGWSRWPPEAAGRAAAPRVRPTSKAWWAEPARDTRSPHGNRDLSGIPGDGVRDIPDVSLFAGTGVWGHYYVMCWSDVRNGGAACTGDPSNWAGAGGTSFASPIMAGIQALVNQKTNSAQGNPNYVYYQLAAGAATCNSSNGDPGSRPLRIS